MFLTPRQLSYTTIALGACLVMSEQMNAGAIVNTETRVNTATGQVATIPVRRGINPIMGLAGLAGIGLGYQSLKQKQVCTSASIPVTMPTMAPSEVSRVVDYEPIAVTKATPKKQRDIIGEIASYDRSILVSAVTGCGKTTLIRAALQRILKDTKKAAGFVIVDPKHSEYGIEKLVGTINEEYPLVSRTDTERECEAIIGMVRWILDDFLVKRQKNRGKGPTPAPLYVVFDEWVALQTKIKSRLGKKALDELNNLVQELIVMGREDNVRVWLIGQSHQCGNIGLSGDIRGNLGLIGLAAPNDTTSIDAMAADSYLFKTEQDRKAIAEACQRFRGKRFYVSTLDASPVIDLTPNLAIPTPTPDPWS